MKQGTGTPKKATTMQKITFIAKGCMKIYDML